MGLNRSNDLADEFFALVLPFLVRFLFFKLVNVLIENVHTQHMGVELFFLMFKVLKLQNITSRKLLSLSY